MPTESGETTRVSDQTDNYVAKYADGSKIEADDNYASISGYLYEAGRHAARKHVLQDYITQHRVLQKGTVYIDSFSAIPFLMVPGLMNLHKGTLSQPALPSDQRR